MGMYDTIELQRAPECPICRQTTGSRLLQTKSGECTMANYKTGERYLKIRPENLSALFNAPDFGTYCFLDRGFIPCYTLCAHCNAVLHYLAPVRENRLEEPELVHVSNSSYSCTIDPFDVDPSYFSKLCAP